MAESLPPNWRAAKDSDGKEYYFNEVRHDLPCALSSSASPSPDLHVVLIS